MWNYQRILKSKVSCQLLLTFKKIITEPISQIQASEMRFLKSVLGVSWRDQYGMTTPQIYNLINRICQYSVGYSLKEKQLSNIKR